MRECVRLALIVIWIPRRFIVFEMAGESLFAEGKCSSIISSTEQVGQDPYCHVPACDPSSTLATRLRASVILGLQFTTAE